MYAIVYEYKVMSYMNMCATAIVSYLGQMSQHLQDRICQLVPKSIWNRTS